MKAIYQPKGKAQEYNQWAVNFFNGCSGKCTYCYNRKGRSAKLLGKDEPTIKKSLIDEKTAINTFEKEVQKYLPHLQEHGLFFNFVSDPFLHETIRLTNAALVCLNGNGITGILLTKQAGWIDRLDAISIASDHAVGFTLTGHDELEPGCSTNAERIQAMKSLHQIGALTWASIEPVIDFKSSLEMIDKTSSFCKHYKIGLQSGVQYDKGQLAEFVEDVNNLISYDNNRNGSKITLYWKDSVSRQLSTGDKHLTFLTEEPFIVNTDYKFWK